MERIGEADVVVGAGRLEAVWDVRRLDAWVRMRALLEEPPEYSGGDVRVENLTAVDDDGVLVELTAAERLCICRVLREGYYRWKRRMDRG